MAITSKFDRQVVERMLEYVDFRSPWTRRLWRVSTVTELRELLECSQAIGEGTLTGGTLEWLRRSVISHIIKDPGLGSIHERATLKNLLPKDNLVANSHNWHVLRLATESARQAYLRTWSIALAGDDAPTISVERCASNIASFLLDEGLSATWVHKWLTWHSVYNSTETHLADLLAEADAKISGGTKTTQVLVTFARSPRIPDPAPAGWLPACDVSEWRSKHGCGDRGIRQYGGLVVEVEAFEPHGAVFAAAARTGRVRARFQLGSNRRFQPNDEAWVEGIAEPFMLSSEIRRVEVHSLERTDQLFNLALADPAIDAALELLEPALDGQTTSAIAGSWASVESLLSGPGDRANVDAADRLARIIACSFVRHELTTLAWEHKRSCSDELAAAIDSCDTNRARAALMERYICDGRTPSWKRPTDELSYFRLRKILPPVGEGLVDVENYVRDALRRLYRQRNLVLHSGKTDAIAVGASLRTAIPLVAAGMDRIVAASVEQRISAMELAARATYGLARYHSAKLSTVVDLLE